MVFLHGNQVSLYYAPESSEGTSPTGQTWSNLGHHSSVDIIAEDGPILVKKSGSVDATSSQLGKRKCSAKININPNQGDAQFFLETYGSSDTPVSLQIFNSAKTFLWRLTGCKVHTISVTGQKYPTASPVTFNIEIFAWTVAFTEASTSTYNADTTSFINWADCTVMIGGVTITTWWDFSFGITNDLDIQHDDLGNVTAITRGDRTLDLTITQASVDTGVNQFNASQPSFATTSAQINLNANAYQWGVVAYTTVQVTADRTKMLGLQLKFQPSTLTPP